MRARLINMRSTFALAAAAVILCACGGGGDEGGNVMQPAPPPPPPPPQLPDPASAPALRTVFAGHFRIGAAIRPESLTNGEADLLVTHMSSVTAEYVMKPDTIGVAEGSYDFAEADALVEFAQTNGMTVRGHTLVWHQTAPDWFFAGDQSDPAAYRTLIRQRLRKYIFDVITHFENAYPGVVQAWDVVNEVASDTPDPANPYRTSSPWYEAYEVGGRTAGFEGEDYIEDAFRFADEARTSLGLTSADLKLMLNDYNTELPGKRENVMRIVQNLLDASVPIDGVGHQLHLQMSSDPAGVTAAFEAVEALSSTLVNHVTELDVSIYSDPESCFSSGVGCQPDYGSNPPQSVLSAQALLYRALFDAFKRPSVTSVTMWGMADDHTWRNEFPVKRTDRPLLFDTNRQPKWAFWAVVDPTIDVP